MSAEVHDDHHQLALIRDFKGRYPKQLWYLFFSEMWERFSYYGMRALLILFMTAAAAQGGLGFSDARAGAIYGLYTAAVYLLALPGGIGLSHLGLPLGVGGCAGPDLEQRPL